MALIKLYERIDYFIPGATAGTEKGLVISLPDEDGYLKVIQCKYKAPIELVIHISNVIDGNEVAKY